MVEGALGAWNDYPAHDRQDLIGGTESSPLTISSRAAHQRGPSEDLVTSHIQ